MPWVKVTCACGYSWETSMARGITEEQARAYFVGKWFNVGNADADKMVLAISLEYHKGNS